MPVALIIPSVDEVVIDLSVPVGNDTDPNAELIVRAPSGSPNYN